MVSIRLTRVGFCRQRAWFADCSSFSRWIRFPAMIAVIRHPRLGVILFDTGYGEALAQASSWGAGMYRRMLPFELPERERIGARLEQLEVDRVSTVFLSHFHPDHIGGLREVTPGVPILCSRQGLRRLRSLSGVALHRSAFFPELLPDDFDSRMKAIEDLPAAPAIGPFPEGRDLAGDGSLVGIPLPGHAAGQYGLLCRTVGGSLVFLCADAAWLRANIEDKAGPAWPVRLLVDDYRAFRETVERLHRTSRAYRDLVIIPSHCEESIAAYGEHD